MKWRLKISHPGPTPQVTLIGATAKAARLDSWHCGTLWLDPACPIMTYFLREYSTKVPVSTPKALCTLYTFASIVSRPHSPSGPSSTSFDHNWLLDSSLNQRVLFIRDN